MVVLIRQFYHAESHLPRGNPKFKAKVSLYPTAKRQLQPVNLKTRGEVFWWFIASCYTTRLDVVQRTRF